MQVMDFQFSESVSHCVTVTCGPRCENTLLAFREVCAPANSAACCRFVAVVAVTTCGTGCIFKNNVRGVLTTKIYIYISTYVFFLLQEALVKLCFFPACKVPIQKISKLFPATVARPTSLTLYILAAVRRRTNAPPTRSSPTLLTQGRLTSQTEN